MVQGYTQEGCGSSSGWYTVFARNFIWARSGNITGFSEGFSSYPHRLAYKQWFTYPSEEFKLSISSCVDREVGGSMLNITGLNHFYYIRNFTDMRCKHPRVLSVIREQLQREPSDGDVFIFMSKDRRIVRMFSFDKRAYSLFEKKFVPGYQFMKIVKVGDETTYRIDWKDVVLLLENPIIKSLNIR